MDTKELGMRYAEIKANLGDDIQLIAASKTQPIEVLRAARDLGVEVFGENRVQELIDKYTPDLTWDFIGRLQTNKVKYLVGKVRLIQSVDREELALAIDKEAKKQGIVQNVLIEVNMGREIDKGGVFVESAVSLAERISFMHNIKLCGIMVVMPLTDDWALLNELYEEAHKLYLEMQQTMSGIKYFSGGMSGDYEIAIRHGVNIVRLGRALFGERQQIGV